MWQAHSCGAQHYMNCSLEKPYMHSSPQAHRAHIELVTAKVERSLLQDTTADLVGEGLVPDR